MNAQTPLVGREAELAALLDALAGRGGLVLVSGEGGIGKTRLVREAARRVEAEGRAVVWGRPEQVSRPGPFALMVDLVDSVAEQRPAASPDARALVGRLSDVRAGGGGADLPVRQIAARTRGLLAHLGERPVAVFEDLHEADEASHAVLVHLARSAPDDGHMLVGTFRPEAIYGNETLERFIEVVTRERLATEVALGPLARDAALALVGAIVGDGVDEGDLARIAELGEGVPFFIEELAASRSSAAGFTLVPGSIARAVLARRQRLDEPARRALAAAALMPGALESHVLARALGIQRGDMARALAAAAHEGLLADRDGRLVFRHALVREAVLSDVVSVEAEDLHRRIAQAIEAEHAGDLGPHAKALARHWYEARDRDRAKRYALIAGERALALAAPHDAVTAFELAVACSSGAPPPEALVGLAEVQIREEQTGDVETLLRRAASGFLDEGRRSDAARALGRVAWVRRVARIGDDPAGVLDEALALVPESEEPGERARLLAQKGSVLMQQRSLAEGERLLRQAAAIAERVGDHVVRAECFDLLAWAADDRYMVEEALTLGGQACREALLSGRAETIGRTHNNFAAILWQHGECGTALDMLDVARERLEQSFGAAGVAIIELTRAMTFWRMGRPAETARLVAVREPGWAHWRGYARVLQAWSSLHVGDRQRARAIVDRQWLEIGLEDVSDLADPGRINEERAGALIAELIIRTEELDGSMLPAASALFRFNRDGGADEFMLSAALLARSALLAGDTAQATEAIERLQEATNRYPTPYFEGMTLEMTALAGIEGADGTRTDLLERAAERFGALPNFVDRGRCLREAGESTVESDRKRAEVFFRRAFDLAVEGGSLLEQRRSEAALRGIGIRPRAGRPKKGTASPGGLSAREEEIAALVAAGATNADIAGRLFLSERTVQDHITHALRKLSLGGRAGLAAWAAKQGLV